MKLGRLILSPTAIEVAYAACLASMMKETIKIIKQDYIGNLSTWNKSNRLDSMSMIHNDDYIDDIQKTQKKTEKLLNMDNVMVSACVLLFGKRLLRYSKKQVKQSIKKMRDEDSGDKKDLDQMLRSFISSNLDLMKIIRKNLVYKTVKTIKDGFASGDDLEDIEEQILDDIDSMENSLKFNAKEQIRDLHINYSRYKLVKLGIYGYIWVDVGDNRVRASHRVLNQKIMSWKDPTIYRTRGNDKWRKKSSIGGVQKQVGEDPGCRCGFIPILFDSEEDQDLIA
jgi:SPP1 gp7 family putative phage head morphogenesis protein